MVLQEQNLWSQNSFFLYADFIFSSPPPPPLPNYLPIETGWEKIPETLRKPREYGFLPLNPTTISVPLHSPKEKEKDIRKHCISGLSNRCGEEA